MGKGAKRNMSQNKLVLTRPGPTGAHTGKSGPTCLFLCNSKPFWTQRAHWDPKEAKWDPKSCSMIKLILGMLVSSVEC